MLHSGKRRARSTGTTNKADKLRATIWQKLVPAVVLILLTACSSYPRLDGPADKRWDASTYFVLGKSLAEGKGYRLLNEPGEIREVQYPPAVPGLIAAHMVALHSTDVLSVGHVLKLTWCLLFAGGG